MKYLLNLLTAGEMRFRLQVNTRGICCGLSGNSTDFFTNILALS